MGSQRGMQKVFKRGLFNIVFILNVTFSSMCIELAYLYLGINYSLMLVEAVRNSLLLLVLRVKLE